MRKTLIFIFSSLCCFFFLISCDKIFLDVSGKEADLQGKWQMDGADTVYFNFQKSLFQYQIYLKKEQMSSVFGYYNIHDGDKAIDLELLTKYAKFPLDYLGWDTVQSGTADGTILRKTYKIERLDKKKLVLSTDNEIMSFHKF